MAGYLSESDFVMVEEGFSTRDLLKELTLGASEATTDEVAAFFVADLGAIVRKHFCFLKCLPRVRPFYAVKCNSSPGVLKVLAQLGLGFSCANKIASVINSALDLYFPEGCGVDVLAELGRYYVTSAFTVAVSITAKKEVLLDQPGREEENGSTTKTIVYHLDEGVYGIFNSVLFDNICPTPILQKCKSHTPCCMSLESIHFIAV
uniref:Orn/DAP/Arg decarboxylase 2 N-terminal domain-containing protein n=1 Tax=Colobus angolensis palliatus TaxID=336983 RepID=A0A2K5JIH0_COLAP